jgi:flagellar assembly factor FliW
MARQQEVEINTRLGRRRISMDKVIYFPRGLAGFENEHEFTLLQIRPEAPLLVLQSMKNPALGLLVADPYSFLPNYSVTVGDAEQKLLRLKNVRQVAVLVTVSIPPGQPELAALNLTGPVLVNHKMRIGLQVPQTESNSPAKFYLQPGPDGTLRPVDDAEQPPPPEQPPPAERK